MIQKQKSVPLKKWLIKRPKKRQDTRQTIPQRLVNPQQQNQLRQRIFSIINQKAFIDIKKRLLEFFGKNYPINYREDYNFNEQWEINRKQIKDISQNKISEDVLPLFVIIIIMFFDAVLIWFRTINFFCKVENMIEINFPVYEICLVVQCVDGYYRATKGIKSIIISQILKNSICAFYIILCLIRVNEYFTWYWIVLEIIIYLILYQRSHQLYQVLRLKNQILKNQYQFKIVDLILILLKIAHFFAILLLIITKADAPEHWNSKIVFQNDNQYVHYLYAFYFTTTTILTVGYGDISPKNQIQVIMILFIQVTGIVTFAYIVNQIGAAMSSLRLKQQILQRDLNIVEKMKNSYCIQADLIQKARNYLILQSNSIQVQLLPQQQNKILSKFSQQLRAKITHSNKLSVLNTSLFFICRWSKHFKNTIASKLNHFILTPSQQLYQPLGRQRLYIIRKGRIQIHAQNRGVRKSLSNLLKIIKSKNKQISDNCYGYTHVLSTKKVDLEAVAKISTICYYIQKQQFISTTKQNSEDYQFLSQLKDKMLMHTNQASVQCPIIQSIRHHFAPTIGVLIRKNQQYSRYEYQYRQNHARKRIKCPRILYDSLRSKQINKLFAGQEQSSMNSQDYSSLQSKEVSKEFVFMYSKQIEAIDQDIFKGDQKQGKQYRNYNASSNRQNILLKYQRIHPETSIQTKKLSIIYRRGTVNDKNLYKYLSNKTVFKIS